MGGLLQDAKSIRWLNYDGDAPRGTIAGSVEGAGTTGSSVFISRLIQAPQ